MARNIIKDLGVVTAYAYAVLHGYTGTEEEFTQEIGNASINAQAAAISSEEAESWAKGTKGGTPVESSDPAYHNSSKYYSEQAADSASSALSAKDAAVAAAATASAAYDVNLLAPNYTDLTFPVKAGQHCIYSGGLYRAIVDILVSESWTAAHWEAAILGNDVSDLKSAFVSTLFDNSDEWYSGGIKVSDGSAISVGTRIKTQKLPDNRMYINCASGYKVTVFGYDGDIYLGAWNGTAFSTTSSIWLTGDFALTNFGDHTYRLVGAKSDDSNISTSDAGNISILSYIDYNAIMAERSLLNSSNDLNTIVVSGIYNCSVSSLPSNTPVSLGGLIMVYSVNGITEQVYFTKTAQYYRYKSASDAWQDWKEVSNSDITMTQKRALSSSDNLNSIVVTGIYGVNSSSLPTNRPSGADTKAIVVISRTPAGYSEQTYFTTSDVYHRINLGEGYSAWKKIVFASDLNNLIEKPSGGDGTSGQLLQSNGDGTTSWTDPVQTVETDTTLSISGAPADAKAVGDAITTISAAIATTEASTTASMAHIPGTASEYFILSGVLYQATADIASGDTIVTSGTGANCQAVPDGIGSKVSELKSAFLHTLANSDDTWSQGGIKVSDGSTNTLGTRIRTAVLPSNRIYVTCASGYKITLFAYNGNTYVGAWNGETFSTASSIWLTGDVVLSEFGDYTYRLMAAKSDDSNISPSDSANIDILSYIDYHAIMAARGLLNNSTDLNNIVISGTYNCSVSSLPNNTPVQLGGFIIVYSVNGITEQIYYTTTNQYYRYKSANDVWGAWKEVSNSDKTMTEKGTLSDSDNLNSVTETGIYRIISSSLPTNRPTDVDVAAVLNVSRTASGYVVQMYQTTSGIYYRINVGGGLSAWKKIVFASDLDLKVNKPSNDGASGQILKTNGDGSTAWIDVPKEADTLFVSGFSVETYYRRRVVVSWDSINIRFDRKTTYTSSDPATYELTDNNYMLILKNGNISVANSFNAITSDTVVLLIYRNNMICGGLLYPTYDMYTKQQFRSYGDDKHDNVYRKSQQLQTVKWTAKGAVRGGEGLHNAGDIVTGIPYTHAKEYNKLVPNYVSLHTFMTAANNEHSLLYTEKIGANESRSAYGITYHGVNCNAYYGSICSAFVDYSIGANSAYSTWELLNADGYFKVLDVQEPKNLTVGDVIYEPGHCIVITKIGKLEDGRVSYITISEHAAPIRTEQCSLKTIGDRIRFKPGILSRPQHLEDNIQYSPSPFVLIDNEDLYNVGDFVYIDGESERTYYRCKTANTDAEFTASRWDTVPSYTPGTEYTTNAQRYVSNGENLYRCKESHTAGATFDPTKWERISGVFEWAAYPYVYNDDIVTFAGDRALFHVNDLIYVNYTKGSYTSMQLYKDGGLIQTLPLSTSDYQIDVSAYCSGAGMYKARLTDGTNNSRYTYFEVVEANVSATYADEKATISFSSTNGIPNDVEITEISGFPVCHIVLTEKEKEKGIITIDIPARLYSERYFNMSRYEGNYDQTLYARVNFKGEYGAVPSEKIMLGTMQPILSGNLVYPEKAVDFGEISTAENVILSSRLNGNTYTFSFTAQSGASVNIRAASGDLKWSTPIPASLTAGTTYLVTIINGIGSVDAIS